MRRRLGYLACCLVAAVTVFGIFGAADLRRGRPMRERGSVEGVLGGHHVRAAWVWELFGGDDAQPLCPGTEGECRKRLLDKCAKAGQGGLRSPLVHFSVDKNGEVVCQAKCDGGGTVIVMCGGGG